MKPTEELTGFGKLFQDLLAPELGSIKAQLAFLHEGQQLIREEAKASEARALRAIEQNSNEIKALIKANDAERRLAETERRNFELERRLAEATRAAS